MTDIVVFIIYIDHAPLTRIFLDQEIDGQACCSLPSQECVGLKLGPEIELCHHIERVKFAFYEQFANLEGQLKWAVSLKHKCSKSSSPLYK